MTPRVVIVRGEIEATQVDLAIKVAGRLRDKNVTIGDRVRKGDQLLTLVSPDLEAKLVQAMAASNIAEVEMQKLLLQTRTDQEQLKDMEAREGDIREGTAQFRSYETGDGQRAFSTRAEI
jgi:HlyD family secretion protein